MELILLAVYELVLFVQWGSILTYSVITGLGDPFHLMVAYNMLVTST